MPLLTDEQVFGTKHRAGAVLSDAEVFGTQPPAQAPSPSTNDPTDIDYYNTPRKLNGRTAPVVDAPPTGFVDEDRYRHVVSDAVAYMQRNPNAKVEGNWPTVLAWDRAKREVPGFDLMGNIDKQMWVDRFVQEYGGLTSSDQEAMAIQSAVESLNREAGFVQTFQTGVVQGVGGMAAGLIGNVAPDTGAEMQQRLAMLPANPKSRTLGVKTQDLGAGFGSAYVFALGGAGAGGITAGTAAIGGLQGSGSARINAKQANASLGATIASMIGQGALGTTEVFGVGGAINRFVRVGSPTATLMTRMTQSLNRRGLLKVGVNMTGAAITEAIQEAVQGGGSAWIERELKIRPNAKPFEEAIEGAKVGGIVGAVFQGVLGGIAQVHESRIKKAADEAFKKWQETRDPEALAHLVNLNQALGTIEAAPDQADDLTEQLRQEGFRDEQIAQMTPEDVAAVTEQRTEPQTHSQNSTTLTPEEATELEELNTQEREAFLFPEEKARRDELLAKQEGKQPQAEAPIDQEAASGANVATDQDQATLRTSETTPDRPPENIVDAPGKDDKPKASRATSKPTADSSATDADAKSRIERNLDRIEEIEESLVDPSISAEDRTALEAERDRLDVANAELTQTVRSVPRPTTPTRSNLRANIARKIESGEMQLPEPVTAAYVKRSTSSATPPMVSLTAIARIARPEMAAAVLFMVVSPLGVGPVVAPVRLAARVGGQAGGRH